MIMKHLSVSELKLLRCVNQHWRSALDQSLDALTPNSLMSKLITQRFPNLKGLHLTNCSNVRMNPVPLRER